ncbi:MAG: hypothetical protein ABFS42_16540, partial [Candidatus Krumholzibacteriota bacterium]
SALAAKGGGGNGGGGNSGGADDILNDDRPISNNGFVTDYFAGAGDCSGCHNGETANADGEDAGLVSRWYPSMMSQAARDPFWQAKVRTEMIRNGDVSLVGAGVLRHNGVEFENVRDLLDYKCNHCHGPIAGHEADLIGEAQRIWDYDVNDDGTIIATSGLDNEMGYTNPNSPRYDEFMDGITCTVCHQFQGYNYKNVDLIGLVEDHTRTTVWDDLLDSTPNRDMFSGSWVIDFDPTISPRELYGNIPEPTVKNMRGFDGVFAAYTDNPNMCGTCHDIRTPVIEDGAVISTAANPDGSPAPGSDYFVEQTTFLEWYNSDYPGIGTQTQGALDRKRCQDCHMPLANGGVTMKKKITRDNWHIHSFRGVNFTMQDIFLRNADYLGIDLSEGDFPDAIAVTESFLNNETIESFEIVGTPTITGGIMTVQVGVKSMAGHKLPTGIQARRVFLNFAVSDAGGVFWESGAQAEDADGLTKIVGANGDQGFADFAGEPAAYEPHYDVIDDPAKVQIYEAVMMTPSGDPTGTILEATDLIKDNRLLPDGLTKTRLNSAPNDLNVLDVRVWGAAESDTNFDGVGVDGNAVYSDIVTYQVPVGTRTLAEVNVDVNMYFQTFSYPFLKDLFYGEPEFADDPVIQRMKNLLTQPDTRETFLMINTAY